MGLHDCITNLFRVIDVKIMNLRYDRENDRLKELSNTILTTALHQIEVIMCLKDNSNRLFFKPGFVPEP